MTDTSSTLTRTGTGTLFSACFSGDRRAADRLRWRRSFGDVCTRVDGRSADERARPPVQYCPSWEPSRVSKGSRGSDVWQPVARGCTTAAFHWTMDTLPC
jgi:hypothetical protein